MTPTKEIYLTRVLEQVPRLLTQMDRDADSPTYGAVDRERWHYLQRDFPSLRFQEAAYTMALLYNIQHKANVYYRNSKIKEWAVAAIEYWEKSLNKDGSAPEWYPMEKSYVCSSFSALAVTEARSLLPTAFGVDARIAPIKKVCQWILRHDESLVSNQAAGAILALYTAGYECEALERLDKLLLRQSPEGWFLEYGGFDVGYSYVLLDYLARLWQRIDHEPLRDAMDKLIDFLSYFIHPDGTTGGCYTSRQTQYIIPSGLEILSEHSPLARTMADVELNNLTERPIIWDDRYLCYQTYYYLIAYNNHHENKRVRLPHESEDLDVFFPEASIRIQSTKSQYKVKNMITGAMYAYDKKTKKSEQTQLPHSKSFQPSPLKTILSRAGQLVVGQSDCLSQQAKKILRKKLIANKTGKSSIYVPSARYFDRRELE